MAILFHDGFGSPRQAPAADEFEYGAQTYIVGILAACQAMAACAGNWAWTTKGLGQEDTVLCGLEWRQLPPGIHQQHGQGNLGLWTCCR